MSLLQIKEVKLKVPGRVQPIISHVDYTVEEHDFVVVLGGNGCGKSSLMKTINRTYKPTKGQVLLSGKNVRHFAQTVFAQSVVTITQTTQDNLFMDMSIFENAQLWEMRTQGMISKASVSDRKAALSEYLTIYSKKLAGLLDTPVYRLSGGEQQILIIAFVLRHPPKLLLLDEHTSALDPKMADYMMENTYESVCKQKITCIMTTHNLEFALKYGNKLVAIHEGKVAYTAKGDEKSSLTRESLLQYCY